MGRRLFSLRLLPSSPPTCSLPPVPMQGSSRQAPPGQEGSSPSFHPPMGRAAGVEGLTELFGTPHPTPRSIVHDGTPSAEEGWAGPVQWWLSLMVALPGGPPRADVSEAAESWPGLLQPLPHRIKKKKEKEKERKWGRPGAGDRTWGRNKGGQLGRGALGGMSLSWSQSPRSPPRRRS